MGAAAQTTMGSVAMDMLKDAILGRKGVRRAGREGVPVLTVGRSVDVGEEDRGGENGDGDADVDMEFAPLVRVESRN